MILLSSRFRGAPPAALVAVVVVLLGPARTLTASELREISDFARVAEKTAEYAAKYKPENVLVVLDIDNTLMAMDQPLGSDQWFEWQNYLLTAEPRSPQLVAPDFPGLLKVQGVLFDLMPMHPTQPDLPLQIGRIQGLGVPTVVLSSRGEDFRPATLYELERNGYEFAGHTLELVAPSRGDPHAPVAFRPYQLDRLTDSGLLDEEAKLDGLNADPADVTFGDGVFLTSGQHKGAMLAVLLHASGHDFKAVVYVDDQDKHVRRVFDAMNRRGIEVTSMLYQREEMNVKRFQYSDKSAVTREWHALEDALEPIGR